MAWWRGVRPPPRLGALLLLLAIASSIASAAASSTASTAASSTSTPPPTADQQQLLHSRDVRALLTLKSVVARELQSAVQAGDEHAARRLQRVNELERTALDALAALGSALDANATAAVPTKGLLKATRERMRAAQLESLRAELEYQALVAREQNANAGDGSSAAADEAADGDVARADDGGADAASRDNQPDRSLAEQRTAVAGDGQGAGAGAGDGQDDDLAPRNANATTERPREMLDGVKSAADQLEKGLAEHTFNKVQKSDSVTIETVLRVEGEDIDSGERGRITFVGMPEGASDDGAADAGSAAEQAALGESGPEDRQHGDTAQADDGGSDSSADALGGNYDAAAAGDDAASTASDSDKTEHSELTLTSQHQQRRGQHGGGAATGVSFLVDPDNNVYVLAKPKDTTVPYEDVRLLFDLVKVVVSSFACGWAVAALGMPEIFGYILAGILLGPSCLNLIKSFVQVETVAQLGIFLMLFVLGLEFSLEKLRGVWTVAVYGSGLLMLLVCGAGALAGSVLGGATVEGLAIGFCASLSSTAVVVTTLTHDEMDKPEGRATVGVLVLQDMYLGVLLAVMPLMRHTTWNVLWIVLNLLLATTMFMAVAFVTTRVFVNIGFMRLVQFRHRSPAVTLLGMLSHCFAMMYLADVLGLSLELGCFVAGLQASVRHSYVENGLPLLGPVRDIFSAIFFASIGLHIYPLFLYQQLPLLLLLTAGTVLFKFVLGFVVLRTLFRFPTPSAAEIALALSQVSEFAFVLAARARAYGLISREIYYLVLGTTALSLLTTPLLWRLVPRPALPARTSSPVPRWQHKEEA